jgi:hypothetical protein
MSYVTDPEILAVLNAIVNKRKTVVHAARGNFMNLV